VSACTCSIFLKKKVICVTIKKLDTASEMTHVDQEIEGIFAADAAHSTSI
jgi:hypothetical protein